MWPGVQNIIYNLLWEILLRVVILGIVCMLQLKVQPRMDPIPEADLLSSYKRPRQPSYVPPWAMVAVVVFVPLLAIYIVFMLTRNFVDTIQAMLTWTLALSVTALITESFKLMVGRPRPDFFYRCFPNGVMSGLCTGSVRDVIEGRKSFPSGHSSFSFCSLGFLSLWMFGKLKVLWSERQSCRTLACLAPLVLAGAIAVSRYYDHHHHWEDIVVGSLLGFASSYLCYHQYYYPFSSEQSGEPLTSMTEAELFHSYEMQCCTRDLCDDFSLILDNLCNKDSLESNRKIN
ncbi:phospholipid phosphatase 5-like [Anticarsia gemmatalis]|uniref:phospholipid phosphatase 5-like n=1 Tax=Anticarsia gemmatalis TaxID=129554 RepID=UPI003F75BAED